jgi:hypothetical protein
VNIGMNLWVSCNFGKSLSSWATGSFSKRNQLHGVSKFLEKVAENLVIVHTALSALPNIDNHPGSSYHSDCIPVDIAVAVEVLIFTTLLSCSPKPKPPCCSYFLTLKMAVNCSRMKANVYKTTQLYIAENSPLCSHSYDNLKTGINPFWSSLLERFLQPGHQRILNAHRATKWTVFCSKSWCNKGLKWKSKMCTYQHSVRIQNLWFLVVYDIKCGER